MVTGGPFFYARLTRVSRGHKSARRATIARFYLIFTFRPVSPGRRIRPYDRVRRAAGRAQAGRRAMAQADGRRPQAGRLRANC